MGQKLFVPAGADAVLFQPRAWLAFSGEPAEGSAEAPAGSLRLWGLHVFNGGPQLRDVVLELRPESGAGSAEDHELGSLPEGGSAWVFAGGPAQEPPHGAFRLWAQGLEGASLFGQAEFPGFRPLPRLPAVVRRRPGIPLAPALPWPAGEYLRIPPRSSLLGPATDGCVAARAFSAWCLERLAVLRTALSPRAAQELAWAGMRAVFGAREPDLDRGEVKGLVQVLGCRLREIQRAGDGSMAELPAGGPLLAVVPGARPAVFLLNPEDTPLRGIAVRMERYRWGLRAALLRPLERALAVVPPRSGCLVAELEDPEGGGYVEVTAAAQGGGAAAPAIWRGGFAEEEAARGPGVPLRALAGSRAVVRCLWREAERDCAAEARRPLAA